MFTWVFIFLVLILESSLYILYVQMLSDIWVCFTNIFFQSISYLFILLKVSFEEQKFYILMKSNLSSSCSISTWNPIVPAPFVTKHIIFLLIYLSTFVKNQLSIHSYNIVLQIYILTDFLRTCSLNYGAVLRGIQVKNYYNFSFVYFSLQFY